MVYYMLTSFRNVIFWIMDILYIISTPTWQPWFLVWNPIWITNHTFRQFSMILLSFITYKQWNIRWPSHCTTHWFCVAAWYFMNSWSQGSSQAPVEINSCQKKPSVFIDMPLNLWTISCDCPTIWAGLVHL